MQRVASSPPTLSQREFLSSSSRRTLTAETRTSTRQRRPLNPTRTDPVEVVPEQALPLLVSEVAAAAALLAAPAIDGPPRRQAPKVSGAAGAGTSGSSIAPHSLLAHRHVNRAVGDKLGAGTFGAVVVTAFPEQPLSPAAATLSAGRALAAKKSPLPPKPSAQPAAFPVAGIAAPGGVLTTHAAVSALHRMAAGQIPVIAVLHPRDWPVAQCLRF